MNSDETDWKGHRENQWGERRKLWKIEILHSLKCFKRTKQRNFNAPLVHCQKNPWIYTCCVTMETHFAHIHTANITNTAISAVIQFQFNRQFVLVSTSVALPIHSETLAWISFSQRRHGYMQNIKNQSPRKLYTQFSINCFIVNEPIRLKGIENDVITSTHIPRTCQMLVYSIKRRNDDRETEMAV